MFIETMKQLKIAIVFLCLITVLTGLLYPMFVQRIANIFFPFKTKGSLIKQNGVIKGSSLIGQSFTDQKYFWGRPSATTPFPYNAESSRGSNMSPLNPNFLATIEERISLIKRSHPKNQTLIPGDLVYASGSGLDPEISPLAAFYQVSRIAATRRISEKDVQELVQGIIKGRTAGILGEPRVNVLELNLALDKMQEKMQGKIEEEQR